MVKELMCAECMDDGFKVQTNSKKETASMLKMHVKNKHHMNVTDAEAKKMTSSCGLQ
jgi:predicted small metal-binding protein